MYFMQTETTRKWGVAILLSDKIDFKRNSITKDKEGHYIKTKGWIQEEDTIFINIYSPNTRAPTYTKQILKRHRGRNCSSRTITE